MQEYLELVRQDNFMGAILYARKHLSQAHPTNMEQIKRAMAALAFKKDTSCSPYKELFSISRWEDLTKQFLRDNYLLHKLTTEPLLNITMQAGLLALKTPQSYAPETFAVNDPMCFAAYQTLAENLPFAYHSRSKIICRLTGEVMDEDNYPLILPNGNAYSRKSMEEMAKLQNGTITDIRTGQVFKFEELKKAFIM